ncbi:MAG TPA: hypothetical protein VKJ00_11980, partial [Thermoanaerobaculia bacterium]|nr:hypothetical protein [Thermoanaerobaculia bacterium]
VRGARFGPDGRSIVYAAAWEGGPLKLYLKQAESPDPIPLALPSADIMAVSPTGELAVALDCQASNNGVCKGELARVPLTGGSPREIAEDVQQADFGRDGELAIVRELTQQRKSRLEYPPGKLLYEATNGYISFPRISPDGKQIAFLEHPFWGDDRGFVAVVDLAGKKRILTKRFEGSLRGLAWSPSGDEIWFAGADGLQRVVYAVRLSGSLRVVYSAPGPLTLCDVSRDGRVLLTREEERNVVLGVGPGETAERDLSWLEFTHVSGLSEDGKILLLFEEGEAAGPKGNLLLRRMDGSPPVRLGEGFGQLSPDGKHIIAESRSDPALLKVLSVGPGEEKAVNLEGLQPLRVDWFPDSRRILVLARKGGQLPRLVLFDSEKGVERSIVLEGAPATDFGVAPDSRHILADRSDGTWALYPIDGGEPRPVAGILRGEYPVRFSRDGRALFVTRGREAPLRVFRIDLASGARSHFRDFEPADKAGLSYVRNVALSADGTAYAYQYRRWLSDLYTVEGLK